MSRENIELVRRVNAAFNSGDIERVLGLMHPDIETAVGPELSTEPDTYRGHDGIRRYFASFGDAMDEIRFHQEGFRETPGSVIVAVRLTAKGRFTRIEVEQCLGQVWNVRHGKANQIRNYVSYRAALKAVGLEE
jgi:ketosteroid isomerase-like protein